MEKILLQSAILLLVPALTAWAATKWEIIRTISPVVLCYAIGILLANVPIIPLDAKVSLYSSSAAVLLAIPLLLLSVDIGAWLRLARSTVISTVLAAAAVTIVSGVAFFFLQDRIEENWKVAGMLVGTFTGGTPNMAAIGSALKVRQEIFVIVNAADVLLCSFYFLFLVSIGPRVFGRVLGAFPTDRRKERTESTRMLKRKPSLGQRTAGILLGLSVALFGGATWFVAPEQFRDVVVVLTITTLAILLSFLRPVRNLPGTYESGQWFLLVFCIAIGSMADFGMLVSLSPWILVYTGTVLFGTILLHLFLCAGMKVDRDTWIITSSAAIFSPAFVGVIAGRLKNREVVVSGVTSGLVGFAVGNYLGMSVAALLHRFFANG